MNLYTAKERRGLIILLILCTSLLSLYYLLPFMVKPQHYDYSLLYQQIREISPMAKKVSNDPIPDLKMEPFDVNEVSLEQLQDYGLSQSVAKTWINYRKAIGGFKDRQQLSKIYGLDSIWLEKNKDNLRLQRAHQKKSPGIKYPESKLNGEPEFSFDPNLADREDLERAGLDSQAVASLLKFKKQGGTIYHKEEMAFLSGIDEETYHQLSASIKIESDFLPKLIAKGADGEEDYTEAKMSTDKPIELDINQSNEYQWQQLKGIGPYYARSIIKYRDQLGGFASVDQVAETYHLPDSVFTSIKSMLRSSPVNTMISINTINIDSLRLHPYVSWKQASILVNYRNNHGPYQGIEDFYKIRVFDSVFVQKMEPYISF